MITTMWTSDLESRIRRGTWITLTEQYGYKVRVRSSSIVFYYQPKDSLTLVAFSPGMSLAVKETPERLDAMLGSNPAKKGGRKMRR